MVHTCNSDYMKYEGHHLKKCRSLLKFCSLIYCTYEIEIHYKKADFFCWFYFNCYITVFKFTYLLCNKILLLIKPIF